MNILAEEQKKLYEAEISGEEYRRREKKFLDLYYCLREKEEHGFLGRMTLKSRKRLHGVILMIYKIKNRIGGFSFEIIGDKRIKTNRPVIFAVTHVGKFDIEVVSEAIQDHLHTT